MKKMIIIAVLLIACIALIMWQKHDGKNGGEEAAVAAPTTDPLDVVTEFYDEWLTAAQSTTSSPFDAPAATAALLQPSVQQYIADNRESEQDPVLCQSVVPERTGARILFSEETNAQVQVLARGLEEKSPHFAVVTLVAENGEWRVSEISCQSGESAPEREFSFDRTGHMIKSVPEPLNSDYWHLVFTENGTPGHTAPLFFDDMSVCIGEDGTEVVCAPDTFSEPTAAAVQGEMTEAGVSVKRVTF